MGTNIFIKKLSQYPWLIFFVSLISFILFSLEEKFHEVEIIENQLNVQQKILDRNKAILINKEAYSRQLMTLKDSLETMDNYFGNKNYSTIRLLLEELQPEMEFSHIKNYQETEFWDNDVYLSRFEGKLVGSLSDVKKALWMLSTNGNSFGPFVRPISVKLETKSNEIYLLFVFDVLGYSDEN